MFAGQSIEDAYRLMKEYSVLTGEPCFVNFNNHKFYSYESWNALYIKATGMNRRTFQKKLRLDVKKYNKSLRLHNAALPRLRREYRLMARGIIDEKYLDKWNECVDVRLRDIYRGYELKCILALVKELNRDIPKTEKFANCKQIMYQQDHTGGSAWMTLLCLKSLHDLGEEVVSYLR